MLGESGCGNPFFCASSDEQITKYEITIEHDDLYGYAVACWLTGPAHRKTNEPFPCPRAYKLLYLCYRAGKTGIKRMEECVMMRVSR